MLASREKWLRCRRFVMCLVFLKQRKSVVQLLRAAIMAAACTQCRQRPTLLSRCRGHEANPEGLYVCLFAARVVECAA